MMVMSIRVEHEMRTALMSVQEHSVAIRRFVLKLKLAMMAIRTPVVLVTSIAQASAADRSVAIRRFVRKLKLAMMAITILVVPATPIVAV